MSLCEKPRLRDSEKETEIEIEDTDGERDRTHMVMGTQSLNFVSKAAAILKEQLEKCDMVHVSLSNLCLNLH